MEDLLQKSDIITMRKDIKNAKRPGAVLQMPNRETVNKAEITIKQPQKDIKEKELEKIIEQTAKQRQFIEKQSTESEVSKTPEPAVKTEAPKAVEPISEIAAEERPEASLPLQIKKEEANIQQSVKENLKPGNASEQEARKKFMEDIEKWASGSKK